MRKFILSVASVLLAAAGNANATNIGYSKEKITRNTFRMGTATTQGQAIRLSKAKLQALKGKTIDFAQFAVGSKNTDDGTIKVFLSTSPDATPIAQGTIKIGKALQWVKWTLDTPYTITGDEENLYIGYTAEIADTYKMLLADGMYDISGYNFALQDGEWVDTYGSNKGSAYISVDVKENVSYADAIIGRTNFDGYFKAGNSYNFAARFINAGTVDISSFDAIVKIDDTKTTKHFSGIDIKPRENYSINLEGIDASKEGNQDISVEIANVNGDKDVDVSDNTINGSVYFYPHNMERSILVEGFTGQECSNCPSGHIAIGNAIAASDQSIVEVSHHAGYFPDMFTMLDDDAYRFYFSNPSSPYAPAVMANRTADNAISMSPVVNADTKYAAEIINHAAESKPYVSLNLQTELDKTSRLLKVKLQMKPHTSLPTDNVLFNVFLVQDSIYGYQSNGGSNYCHNRVFRGTLTGNSWGQTISDMQPGNISTWEKEITIPESIHSSYWTDDLLVNGMYSGKYSEEQTNIKAVLDNMSVVAYVAEYDTSDNTKNVVYNCCEAKLGESYKQSGFDTETGIEDVDSSRNADIHVVNGKINASGDNTRICVYTIDGQMVDADSKLGSGVYVVRVYEKGKVSTKKVLVK